MYIHSSHRDGRVLFRFLVLAILGLMWLSGSQASHPAQAAPQTDFNLYLARASFEPRQFVPSTPSGLTYNAAEAAASGVYILQFTGPVMDAWKDQVTSAGAQLGPYIPNFAFIARMDAGSLAEVQALPFVRWVGPYQPAYKLAPGVSGSPYVDNALSPGGTYFYYVTAVNTSSQESAPSATLATLPHPFASDDEFLDYVQGTSFDYFWYLANPANGLVPDRTSTNTACSIAAVGFALTAYPIGAERAYLTRAEARSPDAFPVGPARLRDLRGGDREVNANIIRQVLSGEERGPRRDAVLLNAAAALFIGGAARTMLDGWEKAAELIDSGRAIAKFRSLLRPAG